MQALIQCCEIRKIEHCTMAWNHRQLNKKRPIVWNYLRSPKMSQVHFNTVSCFIIGFWKNHQTFFHADGILPLFQFRHRKKGLVIFSKPDHKTADKFKMEIAEKHFKGNFRRSVFSYLVVYGQSSGHGMGRLNYFKVGDIF